MEFMYNLTGIDLGAYFAANTAANTSIFAIIILPTLILCILCALALFFADGKCELLSLTFSLQRFAVGWDGPQSF